jgi:hypothetical protein
MVEYLPSQVRVWKLSTALLTLLALVAGALGALQSERASELANTVLTARQQIAAPEARLSEAEKPSLPVALSFRTALFGSGLVAIFKNTAPTSLEVAAVFSSQSTGQQRQVNLVIPPNGIQEIGHAEGWAFIAGQHIRLTNNRYRPAEYDVPRA